MMKSRPLDSRSLNSKSQSRRKFIELAGGKLLLASSLSAFDSTVALGKDDELSVDQAIKRSSLNAPLSMLFQGKTPEEFAAWRKRFKLKLSSLLGDFQPPKKWNSKIVELKKFEKFSRIKLVLNANGFPSLPMFLLKPNRLGSKTPAVVALHGHGEFGYETVAGCDEKEEVRAAITKSNYDYGRQLVERGYIVAVPCMTPFGVRRGAKSSTTDPCAVTFVRMQLLGKVLMGENLRDCLWSFDVLRNEKGVDPERIGCVGLSYGGRMTMLTTAMQPEIKCCVISGALNVMQERILGRYSCGAQVIPGLLRYGDVPEIISMIAPRPVVLETGENDALIVEPWATKAMARIQKAYEASGQAKNLLRDSFKGGHRWNGDLAFKLLGRVLRS